METICPKCGGVAWVMNNDDDIYCPECEQAKEELYEEINHENKMFAMQ